MSKVYLVRHQAHGVVHEFPFASPPTEAQVEKVWTYCFGIHGASHAKTPDEPYWVKVVERDVLGPDELPEFEAPGLRVASSIAAADSIAVSGVATVTPKAGA